MTDFLERPTMKWGVVDGKGICPNCNYGSFFDSWGKGNAICIQCNQEFMVGTKDGKLVGVKLEESLTQSVPCDSEFIDHYLASKKEKGLIAGSVSEEELDGCKIIPKGIIKVSKPTEPKEEKTMSKNYWEADEQGTHKQAEKTESEILGELQANSQKDMASSLEINLVPLLNLPLEENASSVGEMKWSKLAPMEGGSIYSLPPETLVEKGTVKEPFREGKTMGELASYSMMGKLDRLSVPFSSRKEILHFAERMAEEISNQIKPHELHLFQVFVNNLLERE